MCCCGCCCCCKFEEGDDSYCGQKMALKRKLEVQRRIAPHLRASGADDDNKSSPKPHYQYQAPLDLPTLARIDSDRRSNGRKSEGSRVGSRKSSLRGDEGSAPAGRVGDGKSDAYREADAAGVQTPTQISTQSQPQIQPQLTPQSSVHDESHARDIAARIDRSSAASSPEPRARASIDTLESTGSTHKAPLPNQNQELEQQATGGQGSSTGTSDRVRELLDRVHEPEEAPPSYQAATRR